MMVTVADKKVERRLRNAMAANRYVRLHRRPSWDRLAGYVAAVGGKWVLLQTTDNRVHLDGYSAVRLADIRTVQHATASEDFRRRALELHGEWPPPLQPAIRLGRTRDLITDLRAPYTLLVLFDENEDGVPFVGRPVEHTRRELGLQLISPNAVWDQELTGYRFGNLTRIDVGGGYANALLEIGGPPPEV